MVGADATESRSSELLHDQAAAPLETIQLPTRRSVVFRDDGMRENVVALAALAGASGFDSV
jgi:hypothetical protein